MLQPNAGGTAGTPGNRRADRGNCSGQDRRQIFNLSVVAETPRFSQNALRLVASGWRMGLIVSAQSAAYFTVTSGIDNSLTGIASQRANYLGPTPYAANQTVTSWLNPAAFATPAAGTFGNLASSNLNGPGFLQIDMSLSRSFRIREKKTLELRAEAYNVPNRLNAGLPGSALNSPSTFGVITSDISGSPASNQVGDPRIISWR